MLQILVHLIGNLTGARSEGLNCFITPDITKTLSNTAAAIPAEGYLIGAAFTGADIQMSDVLEAARMGKPLGPYPMLDAYTTRLEQRPAHRCAVDRGGSARLPLGWPHDPASPKRAKQVDHSFARRLDN